MSSLVDTLLTEVNQEIDRINIAKDGLDTWLTDNGVAVPAGALIDDMVGMLDDVEAGTDTSDATAVASNILEGKTAYVNGGKVTGTMTRNEAILERLDASKTNYTIPEGYHDGTGKINIATETKAATPTASSQNIIPTSGKVLSKVTVNGDTNLIPENIKSGVSIFGVNGAFEGSGGGGSGGNDDVLNSIITRTISGAYENSEITRVGSFAFTSCTLLTTVSFPVCKSISTAAFSGCTSLTTVSFPACKSIGSFAFHNCSKLISINLPSCTNISGSNTFAYCTSLTTVNLPVCTIIGSSTFNNCVKLTTVNAPICTSIGSDIFNNCSLLTTVSFPACTNIDNDAFYNCSNLTTISFPVCTNISNSAFYRCVLLTTVSFPACTNISKGAFTLCSSLTTASFPACSIIYSGAFNRCFNLKSLYLIGSSVAKLSHSNAFSSTPIGGYSTSAGTYGVIYVPVDLYSTYISSTNWVYFSSRFVSYTGYQCPGCGAEYIIGDPCPSCGKVIFPEVEAEPTP